MRELLYLAIVFLAIPLVKAACDNLRQSASGSQYAEAMDAVLSAVEYVNQTMVDSVKESGCFDEVAQRTALEVGIRTAMALLTEGAKKYIEKTGMDIEEWLKVQIEATIKMKKGVAA